jgi:two-component system response regulator YesN
MIKVVVVEDEDLIRKGLIYTFDWTAYDCVVVGEASNGREGLSTITKEQPDIVITDIRMPIMDGLKMIEEAEDRFFETIIITGYAEFEYARKAIQHQVSEYLLKPIDHDELGRSIKKLIQKIANKKMVNAIQEQVKPYNEIQLIDLDFYYNQSNYQCKLTPEVLDYITTFYAQKINIEHIADVLEVGSSYLGKKFKEDTNHTFNDFLNKVRIQKALEVMLEGERKIYEIAEDVGFSEYKYFSQVFKNYMAHSPSEFMQANLYIKSRD